MRVAILGAGPAGLYLAYLLKRGRPETEIRIYEQNPADATFGFGVVFSDRALEFLQADDPETFAAVSAELEGWEDITIAHDGAAIRIDGIGFAAVGRLKLLRILQERLGSVGVEPCFECPVDELGRLGEADLVVGADGVNSLVRRTHEAAFGTTLRHGSNRFAWFGTSKRFETLTQTFRRTRQGFFNAHHYRYAPDMSTFIVETDEETFFRLGLDRMDPDEARGLCEQVFAEALDGHGLVSNKSIWRQFPHVRNARWSVRNIVLLGDALHTAHFSIGSGTRLAMEDAISLARALDAHPRDLGAALRAYEAERRPIVEKLVAAANASAAWYERFPEHMRLAPIDFAMSYVRRSGRLDLERLRRVSPEFVARYERERPAEAGGEVR